jgi:hypothetical protein
METITINKCHQLQEIKSNDASLFEMNSRVCYDENERYYCTSFLIKTTFELNNREYFAFVDIDSDDYLLEYFGCMPYDVDLSTLENEEWKYDYDFHKRIFLEYIDKCIVEPM